MRVRSPAVPPVWIMSLPLYPRPLFCGRSSVPLSYVLRIWRFHGQVMLPFRRGSAPPLSPLFRVWRFLCITCPPCFEHGVALCIPSPVRTFRVRRSHCVPCPLCFVCGVSLGQVTSLSRRGPPSPESEPIDGVTFLQGDATDPAVLKRVIADGGCLSMYRQWRVCCLNPFRTAVPFWGQNTRTSSSLCPKRDCGSKGVNAL